MHVFVYRKNFHEMEKVKERRKENDGGEKKILLPNKNDKFELFEFIRRT